MDSSAPEAGRRQGGGCLDWLLFALAFLWVVGATWGIQSTGWMAGQLLLAEDLATAPLDRATVSWGNGLVVLLPVLLLAALSRDLSLKATYRGWMVAALAMMLFGIVRLLPEGWTQPAALAQTALSLFLVALFLRWDIQPGFRGAAAGGGVLAAFALGLIPAMPWVAFGALGSALDVLLGLVSAVAFSLLAGALLQTQLSGWPSPGGRDAQPGPLFGGLAGGATLLLLGAGFGFGGHQLILMVALPPLGFAVAALLPMEGAGPSRNGYAPLAALLFPAVAAPLLLVDSKELVLLLDLTDLPRWAATGAVLSGSAALLLGLVLWVVSLRPAWPPSRGVASILFASLSAVSLGIYLLAGQPGLHGDRLFVILKEQADPTPAAEAAARPDGAGAVYDLLSRRAAASQGPLRADLERFGIGYRPFYLVNALEVEGGPLVRLYLSTRPEVDRVLDSPRLRPLFGPPQSQVGETPAPAQPAWNITSIGADRVWRELGVAGRGIVIGQSDSGVDPDHPALRDSYRGRVSGDGRNWLDPWYGSPRPQDPAGHGTFTLALALGRNGIGVAPEAEWFGCSNLARNLGNPALYLECMQFMLAPYPQGGDPFTQGDPALAAQVVNNSWGCPSVEGCDPGSLVPAVRALRAAGIFVVASAGNSGPRCGSVSDPLAIYPEAFSVGASTETEDVWDHSSRGPVEVDGSGRIKPDILAPGDQVLSALPEGSYGYQSGTSAAGPHVAGVVALMWSAQPALIGDVQGTEEILRRTARPYRGEVEGCFQGGVPNAAYGHGLLDAFAAVKAAMDLR